MSKVLRYLACLFMLIFAGNALAAGYSCPSYKKYTSCASGYYMTSSSSSTVCNTSQTAGNACRPCSVMGSNYTCAGGTSCPKLNSVTCSAGYYLKANATSCSPCGGNNYYCKGGTFNVSSSAQGRSTVTAGYYSTGGTSTTRTGQSACGGNNYYCSGGVRYTVSSGYYSTGGTSTTRTGQSQCTGAYWCSGGVRNSCPTQTSGWTRNSGTGWTSYTQCNQTRAATSASTYCSAGTLKQNATSATAWGATTVSSALSAKAGAYVNGTTCSQCTANDYCAGGTAARKDCPSGYPNSAAGSDAITDCYSNTKSRPWSGSQVDGSVPTNCYSVKSWNACSRPACNYVAYANTAGTGDGTIKSGCTTNNASCEKTPAEVTAKSGYYDAGTTCPACPNGYPNSANGNEGGNTKCYISVSGGHYIGTKNSATQSECVGGTYKAAHTVYYGSTSSCSVCGTNQYSDDGAASCTACKTSAGYGNSGTTAASHDGVASCKVTCDAGEYVPTAGGGCVAVGSGYYKTGTMTVAQNATNTTRSACSALSGVSVSGGTYSSVSPYNASTTCRYKAPNKTITGCDTVTSATVSYSGSAWPTTTYTVSADPGYYISGSGTASATCVGCQAGYACAGGTAARDACDGQTQYQDAVKQSSCKTVSSGWYKVDNTEQAQCTGATYCSGGVKNNCPGSYTADTTAGKTSAQQCKISVAKGHHIATANSSTPADCDPGDYRAAHTVNYGSTSSCSACPSGYTSAAGTAGANTECYISVSGGHYIEDVGDNSTNWGTCAAGTYKAAHTVYYGSKSSCSACSGRTKYSAAGASACKTVSSGYYTTGCNTSGNNCTGQSQCTGATYCSGGVQNSCPAQTSGWTRNGGTGWTSYTQCNQTRAATSVSSYCSAGQLKQTATSATAWGASNISTAFQAKAGAYVNGQTCSQCTADNYCTGGTAAPTDCPSGYPNSDAGASAITKCYSNTKSRAWTGSQNACTKPSGCSTVTCNSCSKSACNYVAYANTAGTGDGTVKSGCSTNNESCDQTVKSVTANPGYKVNGTACAICTGATYSAGGAATSCSNCPTIYTDNTASGKKAATECQVVTDGGYYIAANNDDAQTICGVRNYCPSATVNYGSHNSPIACPTASEHLRTTYPDNYYNPTSATATNQTWGDGKDAITDCKAVYTITNARGRFTVESTGYNAETEKYDVGGTKYYTKVNPGYYVKDRLASTYCNDTSRPMYYTDAQPCPAGSYCPGLSSMPSCSSGEYTETKGINSCPANYGNSPAMSDAATDCYLTTTAKNFVATPNAAQTTCTAGGYCVGGVKVNYGSTGGRTPASKGYYVSTTGATTQTPCAAGTYTSSTGQTKCTDAAAGAYTTGCQITSNNTACTGTAVCATNKYSNARASVCIACNTADGYGNSGTTAASHAGQASCKVTCGGGEYVPTAGGGCVNVGVGYWGAGGTVSETSTLARTQCESGLTTIGSGAGADEAGDCGRVLNVNGEKIYLRSTKKTTPSLNVSINGDVFYGNMGTASKGSLRLNSGGTTYSVYDDSM